MTRKTLFLLIIGSLILFSGLGWAIMNYFGPISLSEALGTGTDLLVQVIIGTGIGLGLGLLAWLLINHSYLKTTREFFADIIGPWQLNWGEIVWVSFCAGVGEEILFRGAIQPFLGIGWTSLLFVFIHGYLNPFNAPLTVYGIFMVLAIALLGIITVHYGLLSAIVAHIVIDIILLHKLSNAYEPNVPDKSEE